jgi:SagB-type dehydrogenase family enzyme
VIAAQYHHSTKHHFNRFAASLGYLDWATQPDPWRRFAGAALVPLRQAPVAADVRFDALFDATAAPAAFDAASLAEFLRCSMGLSAWKQFGASRWALRVNPSSGNLHPTEAYVVVDGRVSHYAVHEHALEQRAVLGDGAWRAFSGGADGFLVALTSIEWREAWKYGERAFRYCQHDVGHAVGALRFAAAMLGWRLTLLPWGSDEVAALTGADRGADFADAEREEAECVAVVTQGDPQPWCEASPSLLVDAARGAEWGGRANRLSRDHVEWPAIDRIAAATRVRGADLRAAGLTATPASSPDRRAPHHPMARDIILQRRSAVAFDARSAMRAAAFRAMLRRLTPQAPPFDAIPWPPQVHLLLFVHRVAGLTPGVYAWLRDAAVRDEWRAAMRPEFLWEPVAADESNDPLFLLLPMDVTWPASRVSCDQDIASDGFFSLAMIARFEGALAQYGEWFYRRLFWECGVIGQVLYLEAEAAGARATGIGCFYDDAVHELAGLSGAAWQSLYHFSMGVPVEDERLTTSPGYSWEAPAPTGHLL